jgi:RimJ/RimL family protein N-acetyltransferase
MSDQKESGRLDRTENMSGKFPSRQRRSSGILSPDDIDSARSQGIPLAFDPLQFGWVTLDVMDDLGKVPHFRFSDSLHSTEPTATLPVEDWLSELEQALAELHAGKLSDSHSRLSLALGEVDRIIQPWVTPGTLSQIDPVRNYLQVKAVQSLRRDLNPDTEDPSVRFRDWQPDDLHTYKEMLDDPQMWQYIPDTKPEPFTPEIAEQFLKISMQKSRHDVRAIDIEGSTIGQIRVAFDADPFRIKSAEISFWIARAFWGRGYVKRALKQFLRTCPQAHNLDLIYAWIHPENVASHKAVTQAQFVRDPWNFEPILARQQKLSDFHRFKFFPQ